VALYKTELANEAADLISIVRWKHYMLLTAPIRWMLAQPTVEVLILKGNISSPEQPLDLK
jgi:hypothetical protein